MPNTFDSFGSFDNDDEESSMAQSFEKYLAGLGQGDDEPPQFTCASCGHTTDDEDELLTPADGWLENQYCEDCLTECDWCGNSYRYISDHRDNWCDECGQYRCNAMSYEYCEECDRTICADCGGRCTNCDASIHSWDWKPFAYAPKGANPNGATVHMGFELEIEGDADDIVSAVHDVDDSEWHLYMKHDGSVEGVEIVSHPATLDWVNESFATDRLFRGLRNNGNHVRPRDNGLHIHVSRDSFRDHNSRAIRNRLRHTGNWRHSHAMIWLMFIYRNADQIDGRNHIARRANDRWAHFNPLSAIELRERAMRPVRGDRYVAVNCNNDATYELRFFASTLDANEFRASLQFAEASVEYTRGLRTADVARGALEWDAFVEWVRERAQGDDDRYSVLMDALLAQEAHDAMRPW